MKGIVPHKTSAKSASVPLPRRTDALMRDTAVAKSELNLLSISSTGDGAYLMHVAGEGLKRAAPPGCALRAPEVQVQLELSARRARLAECSILREKSTSFLPTLFSLAE